MRVNLRETTLREITLQETTLRETTLQETTLRETTLQKSTLQKHNPEPWLLPKFGMCQVSAPCQITNQNCSTSVLPDMATVEEIPCCTVFCTKSK
ncbi:MAG: pentapeptide repeat-containing protein [Bacteroidetes bacterium]|nr:pentapeptide repeat-containing protein [Bacteroidota bacterium]